jgi:ribosomal protein S11
VNTTTITITDPELLAKLAAAEGRIVFRGPGGEHVKTAETVAQGALPPGVKSPFTDEQIQEARKSPNSGITLAEFWEKVKRGEWR